MIATLPGQEIRNAVIKEMETIKTASVVVLRDGSLLKPVEARWYRSRRGVYCPVYCSVWCHSHPIHLTGHGKVSGYGYEKSSTAFEAALNSAGIKLSEPIDGAGEYGITEALKAVARAMGFETITVAGLTL